MLLQHMLEKPARRPPGKIPLVDDIRRLFHADLNLQAARPGQEPWESFKR